MVGGGGMEGRAFGILFSGGNLNFEHSTCRRFVSFGAKAPAAD